MLLCNGFTDNLQIDFQFTFNLSKEDDKHYTQINFMNTPPAVSSCTLVYKLYPSWTYPPQL